MSKMGTLYSTFEFHPSPELCPIANSSPTSGRQGVWIGERYGRGSTWKRYTRDQVTVKDGVNVRNKVS